MSISKVINVEDILLSEEKSEEEDDELIHVKDVGIWAVQLKCKSDWGCDFIVHFYWDFKDAQHDFRNNLMDEIEKWDLEAKRNKLKKMKTDDLIDHMQNVITDDEKYVYEISMYNVLNKIS